MNCLVTGGAGFIGSHLVDELIKLDHKVTILDNLSTGSKENINPQADFYNVDISTVVQKELNNYFKDIDIVFHLAALPNVQYSIEYPLDSNKANTDTTIKVLECMRTNFVRKIVYSSSCSIYGNAKNIPTNENEPIDPLSPYALQKYIGEQYCYLYNKIFGLEYVILRYFNVYGERMSSTGSYVSVLSHFIRSMKNNQPLNIVNDGNQKRDFVYVKDVVNANIIGAFNNQITNHIFNIGNGKNYSINTIADWFELPKQYGEHRLEPNETLSDITKANFVLGWYPKQDLQSWIRVTKNNI